MSQINVETARGFTHNWGQVRGNAQQVQAIFQPYHYFQLNDEFDWTEFVIPGVVARGYLGYTTPNGPFIPGNLQLLLINAEKDIQLAARQITNPYIYSATYTPSNIPVPGPVNADAKISRWTQGYQNWCNTVIPMGMTQVFDIPLFDLLKQVPLGSGKKLQVFFGLRLPEPNPQLEADLITYHPETDQILHFVTVDDFTTPKPPFGSVSAQATYGLLN